MSSGARVHESEALNSLNRCSCDCQWIPDRCKIGENRSARQHSRSCPWARSSAAKHSLRCLTIPVFSPSLDSFSSVAMEWDYQPSSCNSDRQLLQPTRSPSSCQTVSFFFRRFSAPSILRPLKRHLNLSAMNWHCTSEQPALELVMVRSMCCFFLESLVDRLLSLIRCLWYVSVGCRRTLGPVNSKASWDRSRSSKKQIVMVMYDWSLCNTYK